MRILETALPDLNIAALSRLTDSGPTRRQMLAGTAALIAQAGMARFAETQPTHNPPVAGQSAEAAPYSADVLPPGIRSRFVEDVNGIRMHVLEAGFETKDRPAVVLVHGFPELAYSWRKVMLPIAEAGFHVIAPDRRGYGRTSGWDVKFDDNLDPFTLPNHVCDVFGLVSAFGYKTVQAVIGHDLGSSVAAWCSLIRPDVFRSVVLMSAPFPGPPAIPFKTADAAQHGTRASSAGDAIYDELAKLDPPRKHYQKYFATREANEEMWHPPQGMHNFLRAYYHVKSADWKQNVPYPLQQRSAAEWAKLPRYYVMDLHKGMAETVAPAMPSPAEIAACKWLPDNELRVYSSEYGRTGFQGGFEEYRVRWIEQYRSALQLYAGRTIDVPSLFIAGKADWSVYQVPGNFEAMQKTACTRMLGSYLIEGAGHWVQQEQPEEVSRLLLQFLGNSAEARVRPVPAA
jgi:pimeloyl-ACP methyl ester carboxylesterase